MTVLVLEILNNHQFEMCYTFYEQREYLVDQSKDDNNSSNGSLAIICGFGRSSGYNWYGRYQ